MILLNLNPCHMIHSDHKLLAGEASAQNSSLAPVNPAITTDNATRIALGDHRHAQQLIKNDNNCLLVSIIGLKDAFN